MGRGSAEVQVEDRQGTVMRLGFVLAALLASQLALAQTGGSQSAFEAGKLLGQGKNQGAFSGITGGSAQNSIPRYGTSTPEANYFAGGKGETFGPGIGKMQSCATYTPGSDRVANQECEAVNFLARNPNVRPQFNIGQNDPMMQKYRNLRDNAEQAFAQFFPGGRGSSNQCVTRNETIPGQYSTETCVSMQEVGTQQCTIGRVINIDTDANFQCEQSINSYESLACQKRYTVNLYCDAGILSGGLCLIDAAVSQNFNQTVSVSCSSWGRQYYECHPTSNTPIETITSVRLIGQASKAQCIATDTAGYCSAETTQAGWGTCNQYDWYTSATFGINGDRKSVWVNHGCRGTFAVNGQSCPIGYTADTSWSVCVACPSGYVYYQNVRKCGKPAQKQPILDNGCADLEARAQ
ncbi:hypothetical protein [Azovibrio restrictus]|uniref:hypothetical protein n=1 Tax=Azovibrio restrictus TaxID=146938 RepID=UPI0026EE9B97|nr:hypothetical protein [Azovibrio restrictus]